MPTKRFADDRKKQRQGVEKVSLQDLLEYEQLIKLDDNEQKVLSTDTLELKNSVTRSTNVTVVDNISLLIGTLPKVLNPKAPLNDFSVWLRVFVDEVGYGQ